MSETKDLGLFLSRFLRNPRTVGAVAPSSRFLAQKMLADVAWTPKVKIVEFGPGTGPFTHSIFEKMPTCGHYLGIELNPSFVLTLQKRFPGADIVQDSVERLIELCETRDLLPIDHVISGLPFASLPGDMTTRVLNATFQALRPGGTFTTFQYVHSYLLGPAVKFRDQMTELFGPLEGKQVELRNLPPAMIFSWKKPE